MRHSTYYIDRTREYIIKMLYNKDQDLAHADVFQVKPAKLNYSNLF